MKKLLSIILSIALLITSLPLGAFEIKASSATSNVPDHVYDNACDTICNKCGANRAVEPHYTLVETIPYTMQDSDSYPFTMTYYNGHLWYTSTNKEHYSSATYTITAIASATFKIYYKVSCEEIGDKLIIKKNSEQLESVTGVALDSISVSVVAGDQLTFTYLKNRAWSSYDDNASFRIDSVVGSAMKKVPAQEVVVTCSGPVVCSECGITVKSALEHIYDNDCDVGCNACDFVRTITHTYTANCDETCNVCSYNRIALANHTYSNNCDTTCNNCDAVRTVTGHVYSNACDASCNECNSTRAVQDHIYANGCDTTCNECGATRMTTGHMYSNACDTTCNTCGATRSVPNHSYTVNSGNTCSICKFSKTPKPPVVQSIEKYSVVLEPINGLEYSNDGINWQSSNAFSGLTHNTAYTFYQRVAASDIAYVSEKSVGTMVVTLDKKISPAPKKPVAIRVTATSVTLAPYTGYEYSKDGVNWQKNNVFEGLNANTSYNFYQRIAETADVYASIVSSACNVTTSAKSACSISPAAPIVAETTTSKVVLVSREGYEYSKNGTTWQTSNTFSGLSANTSYTFYQRVAETSSELASAKSIGVTVKTFKAATGITTSTNFQKLYSYIERNGRISSGGIRFLPITMTVSGKEYDLELSLKGQDIQFYITYFRSDPTLSIYTSFILQENSKDLITNNYIGGSFTISSFPYYVIDYADNTIIIDRSTYTGEKTYTLNYGGSYITASYATDVFNPHLQLCILLFDKYLYNNLNFGMCGLGFTSFTGYGSTVCDLSSAYHKGSTEVRNIYSATCTTNGYTGDTYCTNCGEKITSGSVVACIGSHTYANSCDKTCNTCGEERVIDHQYSNICDSTCNFCNATRTEIEHIFDNECDEVCNGCSKTRKAPHIYDNSKDLICNNCGYERPPYTPGNIDDDVNGVVDLNDVVVLSQVVAKWSGVGYNEAALDVNGDGAVDLQDVTHLAQYVAKWQGIELH